MKRQAPGAAGIATLSSVCVLGMSPGTSAQPTPKGDQFQINSFTTGEQIRPSVGIDDDQNLVVVWQSYGSGGTDSSYWSVQGQRYGPDGTPSGAQFQVNAFTTGSQIQPSVSMNAAGNFVVVWVCSCGPGWTTQGQRYSADGTPLGGEFQVNTTPDAGYPRASVALDPGGNFVVVWESVGSSGDDASSTAILGQRYASDGTPLGSEFQVNSYTTGEQEDPEVATGPNGDFVVVWSSEGSGGSDTSLESVQGQRFASDGTPLGVEFQVNTFTTNRQLTPAVALDADGGFVVVWTSEGSPGDDSHFSSVQGRRYAPDGSPLGDQFQINTETASRQQDARVASDRGGRFAVVWASYAPFGADPDVRGRLFGSGGLPLGGDFRVNSLTAWNQYLPDLRGEPGGDFVVVWTSRGSSGSDDSQQSIQGQRYAWRDFEVFVAEQGVGAAGQASRTRVPSLGRSRSARDPRGSSPATGRGTTAPPGRR